MIKNNYDVCLHIGNGGKWLADFYIQIKKQLTEKGISVLFYTDVFEVKEALDAINETDYIFLEKYEGAVDVDWAMTFVSDLGFNPRSLYNSEQKFYDLDEAKILTYFSKKIHALSTLKDSSRAKYYITYEGDEIDHNLFRVLGRMHKGVPLYWGISNLDIRTHYHYSEKRYSETPRHDVEEIPAEDLSWIKEYLINYTKKKTNLWGDPSRDDVKFKLSYLSSGLKKLRDFILNKSNDPRRTFKHAFVRYFKRLYRRQYAFLKYADFDRESKFYYFPLHVPFDSQLTQRGLPFYNQASLIETISNYLPYGSKLVVKEHPMGRGYYSTKDLNKIANLPNVVLLDVNTNSHDLVPKAKAIFVINSSVGYEALMYQKNVVTFGRSFYRNQGLTIDIDSLYDLENVFERIDQFKVNTDEVYKFLYRVKKNTYPVDLYNINEINYMEKVDAFATSILSELKKVQNGIT